MKLQTPSASPTRSQQACLPATVAEHLCKHSFNVACRSFPLSGILLVPLRTPLYLTRLMMPAFQGVFRGLLQNPCNVITGITVSSYCRGALCGCIPMSLIGDVIGSRKTIWLAMSLIAVGARCRCLCIVYLT
ncbi:hypothetical protein EJ03DRAFT_50898 [Teratosphaeria nubilosa]|uniref:Major facilitator superfamily (MFS) profile domain-containing protein n=1 Tax=Teratosphaeria nubilosa TaxID=161662 RepID=A0A6G1LDG9_9PEZI|nr:hypothetical protein EJ03DRAFT_50898 [Teratosphaeria nubilosa]